MSQNEPKRHFIREIIEQDIRNGKNGGRVHTRFPPEPNGYLHIGHAKAICINFGLAADYNGLCNLRFDDTNPETEEVAYVESIKQDIRWLGFDWEDREFYASDYFEKLAEFAVDLIHKGKAYVCDLSADEVSAQRGTLTEPGRESPYRGRSVEENLDLFRRMRAGEFPDGSCATPSSTGSEGPTTIAAAMPGASIRPMTGPTGSPTPSRASPIRSAAWSSRSTGRSTTGSSTSSASTILSRSSSPG
jgi:hypothetical protein